MELQFDPSHFDLIVLDDGRCTFGIVGPMENDTAIDGRIQQLRAQGRRLTCMGPANSTYTAQCVIDEIAAYTGYRYVQDVFA